MICWEIFWSLQMYCMVHFLPLNISYSDASKGELLYISVSALLSQESSLPLNMSRRFLLILRSYILSELETYKSYSNLSASQRAPEDSIFNIAETSFNFSCF